MLEDGTFLCLPGSPMQSSGLLLGEIIIPTVLNSVLHSWGAWSVGAAQGRGALLGLWSRPCLQQPSILSHIDPGFQLCYRKMLPEEGWQLASQQCSLSLFLQQRCFQLIFLDIDLFCIFMQNK